MRFLLLFGLLLPQLSFSQDFFNFLSPDAKSISIEVEGNYLPMAGLENDEDESHVIKTAIGANQKVFDDGKTAVIVGAKTQKLDTNSKVPVVRDFYNQQGSVSLRRSYDEDKFWLASVSYGSASDRPFRNGRDSTLGVNYIQKLSSKWFLAANYSNNRSFLNNVPLPGFFYVHEMTREKSLVVGFPFVLWMTPLSENFSIRYFGLLPWVHKFKLLYTKWRFIKPYIGADQAPETFFRHDRTSRYDRFFWYERRALVGVEGNVGKDLRYDFSSGLAFERKFFEARNFSEEKEFLINLENSWFAALNFRLSF